MRAIPRAIDTGCDALDSVWDAYAAGVLERPGVMIPDTDEDLNWHAFLGHTVDMQGFRAAIFAGVDAMPSGRRFHGLRQRGVGVPELAGLWQIEPIRDCLTRSAAGGSMADTLYPVLRRWGDGVGRSLAEALETFPYRKQSRLVRALLENSAKLEQDGFSFRNWLRRRCNDLGAREFPPADFRLAVTRSAERPQRGRPPRVQPSASITLEAALVECLKSTFYQVGDETGPYTLCDWQLGLWNDGKTALFENFKLDSFHQQFVKEFGSGVVPPEKSDFSRWWLARYPTCLRASRTSASGWVWTSGSGVRDRSEGPSPANA